MDQYLKNINNNNNDVQKLTPFYGKIQIHRKNISKLSRQPQEI